jgi:hypothetical protein
MSKTKGTLAVIGITVAIVIIGGWALAHGPWGASGYGPRGYDGYADPYSNLSPERREKLQAQEQEFYQDTADLRRELHRKSLEMERLWTDSKADPENIKAKQGEVFELKQRLQNKVLEHRMAIRELVPEEAFGERHWGPGYGKGYGHHYGWRHMWNPTPGFRRGYGGGRCW